MYDLGNTPGTGKHGYQLPLHVKQRIDGHRPDPPVRHHMNGAVDIVAYISFQGDVFREKWESG